MELMIIKNRYTKHVLLLILVIILSNSFLLTATAGKCEYGSLYAWFRKYDEVWANATSHPTLKIGEEFEVKANITAKKDLSVMTLQLYEFGTPVFEVLEGPSIIGEYLDCGYNLMTNDSFSYTWKLRVRPNTSWVDGFAPLEVFSQFDKDQNDNCKVSFDVIVAYIVDELWEGYVSDSNECQNTSDESSNVTPGFEIMLIFFAIALVFFYRKKSAD